MLAVDGFVYAIGGYDGVSQLKSVERYDTEKDEWELVAPMRSPRSALAVALLGGKIYALGEYSLFCCDCSLKGSSDVNLNVFS